MSDVRLIDFFEAVMERPYLYTSGGTYAESVAFLEGWLVGVLHHRPEIELREDSYDLDAQRYQIFREWAAKKFVLSYRNILKSFAEQTSNPFETTLQLYREFKSEFGN